MDIRVTEHIKRIVTVALSGRVDAFSSPAVRERLDALLSEGVRDFVIDLAEVPFLDSAGLAVLVSALKAARRDGGDVLLVRPREDGAQRILRLTKFDQIFKLAESESEALRSF
jgi:anti-sigma B factor antagonist